MVLVSKISCKANSVWYGTKNNLQSQQYGTGNLQSQQYGTGNKNILQSQQYGSPYTHYKKNLVQNLLVVHDDRISKNNFLPVKILNICFALCILKLNN